MIHYRLCFDAVHRYGAVFRHFEGVGTCCVLMQFIVMVQLNWPKGLSSRAQTMISTTEKQDWTVFFDRPFLFSEKFQLLRSLRRWFRLFPDKLNRVAKLLVRYLKN